ncbi:ROK family protein, partial [Mesorhizobium sp. M1C.F.Ca.ET.144.01.1.1]
LTKQAVSNIIDDLERDGLVVALDAVRKGRGQPFTPYRLVPEGAFAIGLQIDRHLARVVVVDLVGNVMARAEANLPLDEPSPGVQTILGLVADVRRELAGISAQSERRLVGLGVAMPGPFGLKESDDKWMMPAWQQFPLLE